MPSETGASLRIGEGGPGTGSVSSNHNTVVSELLGVQLRVTIVPGAALASVTVPPGNTVMSFRTGIPAGIMIILEKIRLV